MRVATKCVPGLRVRHLEHEECLKTLRIPSMSNRRICGDVMEVYKFTHGVYNSKSPLKLNDQENTRITNKLKNIFAGTSLRQNFFANSNTNSNRITNTWNTMTE